MSARTWREGDPEPADHPAVVDNDDKVWRWRDTDLDDDFFDGPVWVRQYVRLQGSAVVGMTESDWEFMLIDHGPVREATEDEAATLTVGVT